MEVLVIMAIVACIGTLVVKAVQTHNREVAASWSEAAERLGMRFDPGSFMRSKSIHGRKQENRVEVDTFKRSTGQSSTTYTRYRIYFPEPIGLGLHLKHQGFMSDVAAFFGSQDIEVGDPEFDPQVVVKGSRPDRIAAFLTPSRRLRILRLFHDYPGCEIKDHSIEWSKRGNETQGDEIVATVRRLTFAASRLCESSESERSLDRALEARREGRLDEALQHVRETPSSREEIDPDVLILEGQILETGGREEEAAEIFDRASRVSSGKPDVGSPTSLPVSETPVPEPELEPPAPEPEPERPAPEPEPSETARDAERPALETPAASATIGPDVAIVCENLFAPGVMSFKARRVFDERYKDRRVRWSGRLRQVTPYEIDLVFRGEPGTKIVIDVHEVAGSAFARTAQAIVQLPTDALEGLSTRIGERITFEGRLLSCDALMRNLYVGAGELV